RISHTPLQRPGVCDAALLLDAGEWQILRALPGHTGGVFRAQVRTGFHQHGEICLVRPQLAQQTKGIARVEAGVGFREAVAVDSRTDVVCAGRNVGNVEPPIRVQLDGEDIPGLLAAHTQAGVGGQRGAVGEFYLAGEADTGRHLEVTQVFRRAVPAQADR